MCKNMHKYYSDLVLLVNWRLAKSIYDDSVLEQKGKYIYQIMGVYDTA